jgi:hypothetical protein
MNPVDLCNLALDEINENTIEALDEESKAARRCNRIYPVMRDELLASHPWSFAERTVSLSLLSGVTPTGWDYAYGYPSDCIKPRKIYNENSTTTLLDFRQQAASDLNSRQIWTDVEDAVLVYTARITVLNLFDPMLIDAFKFKLASSLASSIKEDRQLSQDNLNKYLAFFEDAKAIDAKSQQDDRSYDSHYEDARA